MLLGVTQSGAPNVGSGVTSRRRTICAMSTAGQSRHGGHLRIVTAFPCDFSELVILQIRLNLLLLGAATISRTIGATGVSLFGRIMGMLLAALAVSMVLSAIAQWLGLPQLA